MCHKSIKKENDSKHIELGTYAHPCENQLVCKATNDMVPHFNAGVFLENKKQIGKVDEILGPMKEYVSVYRERTIHLLHKSVLF